jgi:hypothetical protein
VIDGDMVAAKPCTRAIVSDDGSTIRLMLYTEGGRSKAARLAPMRAVALAGELIRSALPRLSVVEELSARGTSRAALSAHSGLRQTKR